MTRGDIYLADLGKPVGHEQSLVRAALVISMQPRLDSRPPVVVVAPLTRTVRGSVTHVEIEPDESGLRQTSRAMCEDLRAIFPERLSRRFGNVGDTVLSRTGVIRRRLLVL